jgi:cation diffusion facilitator family transporter
LKKRRILPYFGKEFWMTRLLLNLFVPGWEGKRDSATRSGMGSLSGIVGIVCNLLLFTGKLLVGTLAGSVSVTADAMNNLSDASSSIVTLLGFRLGRMPADEEHPYGHARFEYLSGLGVAVMIIVIGFELAKSSLSAIFTPVAVEFSPVTTAVLAASLLLKLWLQP